MHRKATPQQWNTGRRIQGCRREAFLVILQTNRRKIHGKQMVEFGCLLLSLLTKMHENLWKKRHPSNGKQVAEFGRLVLSFLTKVHEK